MARNTNVQLGSGSLNDVRLELDGKIEKRVPYGVFTLPAR
jgi:hypothetical protein